MSGRCVGRGRHRDGCRGQAATEALVATVAIAAALCLPWFEGESPASLLLGALLGAARGFHQWLFLL